VEDISFQIVINLFANHHQLLNHWCAAIIILLERTKRHDFILCGQKKKFVL